MRRVCLTSIVPPSPRPAPHDGPWTSTGFIMAVLAASLAAAMLTMAAMFGVSAPT